LVLQDRHRFSTKHGFSFLEDLDGRDVVMKLQDGGEPGRILEIHYNGEKYSARTMNGIIRQSGIVDSEWITWCGNNRAPQPVVTSLFDQTGNMVLPWAEAGFLCYCVDIKHPAGESRQGNIIRVGADARETVMKFPSHCVIKTQTNRVSRISSANRVLAVQS